MTFLYQRKSSSTQQTTRILHSFYGNSAVRDTEKGGTRVTTSTDLLVCARKSKPIHLNSVPLTRRSRFYMGCANTKTGAAAAPQEASGGTEAISVKTSEHANVGVTDGSSSDPGNSHLNGQTNGEIDTENSTKETGQKTGEKDVNSKEEEPTSEAEADKYMAEGHEEETTLVKFNGETETQSDTQRTNENAENEINEVKKINEDVTSKTITVESAEDNATKAIEHELSISPNNVPDSGEKPQAFEEESAGLDNTITSLGEEKDQETERMGENGCGEAPITATEIESAEKEHVEV
ncbi:uncharacterized protein LOC143228352 [Tachypleus tridentatus]|uniref:uncharacterized protein LOC143228352 n=1 Tax=Tachypleus tridentatus TaxID=6853 RepID=UPI003FD01E8B